MRAAVVGAGFFGCEIAVELRRLGFGEVVLYEREPAIMRRASFVNQARIHNGYHYPRALSTADRCHRNFQPFCDEFAGAVRNDFIMHYAIAHGSLTSAEQFLAFCHAIDLPVHPAARNIAGLFSSERIAAVFETSECAFNAEVLASIEQDKLSASKVACRFGAAVEAIMPRGDGAVVACGNGEERFDWVFNATYAGLSDYGGLRSGLKHELTEIGLIDPPAALDGIAVTVMDGSYFSTMPFPPDRCYSISHVHYTPHEVAADVRQLSVAPTRSNIDLMLRDASRYLPCLADARPKGSLFEIKTTLAKAEDDDARPVLFEASLSSPRVISVLGAKMDNIFDLRHILRANDWSI